MATEEEHLEALDDASLANYLADEALRRREKLSIAERSGRWFAETYQTDRLSSGRSVMLGAAGRDRRTAMLELAEKLETQPPVAAGAVLSVARPPTRSGRLAGREHPVKRSKPTAADRTLVTYAW